MLVDAQNKRIGWLHHNFREFIEQGGIIVFSATTKNYDKLHVVGMNTIDEVSDGGALN